MTPAEMLPADVEHALQRRSTSCNSITPISRNGLQMRPRRYQGARRSWNAFTNANNKKGGWRCRQMTYTRIGVTQALNPHVGRVFESSRKGMHWGRRKLKRDQWKQCSFT